MKIADTLYTHRREAMALLAGLPFSQLIPNVASELGAIGLSPEPTIGVEYPEVYELSNIILAMTQHGLEDEWEVQKDFPYYDVAMEYFDSFKSHPIISAANFSRERWMEFLSFRTDAYAFVFSNEGQLQRTSDFQSFEIRAFDDHLDSIQDFADKSNFRQFFNAQSACRNRIVADYKRNYMIEEMRDFLEREFGDYFSAKRYIVALSPFVGAQNLHRDVSDTLTVDFPPVAMSILRGNDFQPQDQASQIHTLFTEMDHGYVNPTTENFGPQVEEKFDGTLWSNGSGYEDYPFAVFNEYMTWALFDIFTAEHFPAFADQVSFRWHVQNESRGFPYSYDFAQILLQLRRENPSLPVRALYPELLDRLSVLEPVMSKARVLNVNDEFVASDLRDTWVELVFSEPMEPAERLSMAVWQPGFENFAIELTEADIAWNEDATRLSVRVSGFDRPFERAAVLLNGPEAKHRLFSQKGLLAPARSGRLVVSG